ncbi:MAG: transglycosylase family protein [Propionibacteriales bacterium]|nr:transglycosylase family protein [Propionibacteriales bacterium]
MKKIITTAALSLALLASGTANAAAQTPTEPTSTTTAATTTADATTLAPTARVIQTVAKPHKITLKVGNGKRKKTKTRAATVADLLALRGITLAATDIVSPAPTKKVTKGLKVTVQRVTVSSLTRTEVVAAPMTKQNNPTMRRGLTKVLQAGVPGSAERTYTVLTINGTKTKLILAAETVLVAPVAGVLEVGTKGKPLNLAHLKLWNKIAKCESGGRWHINTGNGYYGGLQFALGTWRAYGGRDFASKPHKATKAEQITVANRVYKKQGTRPWGCA